MDILDRTLDSKVRESLKCFIKAHIEGASPTITWPLFYGFIRESYRVEKMKRPSVSQLFKILTSRNIENPGSLAVTYAHCLLAIAMHEERKIYGPNNFNV